MVLHPSGMFLEVYIAYYASATGSLGPAEKSSCSRSLVSNLPSLSPPFCAPGINLLL